MAEAVTLVPDGWPEWQADPHIIGFCQPLAITIGLGTALVIVASARSQLMNNAGWQHGFAAAGPRWSVACAYLTR